MVHFNIPATIEIVGDISKIERAIVSGIKPIINRAFIKAAPSIESSLRILVKTAIMASPEYKSLIAGSLKGEFGLVDPIGNLESILNVWVDSIVVKPVVAKLVRGQSTIDAGISIRGIRSSMSDVTKLPQSIYISDNGQLVPWLDWLLLYGDQVILTDHHISFNLKSSELQYSRTELALMKKGGTYRVPPEYSGVKGSNFVTRSLESIKPDIKQLVMKEVKNALR